MRILGSPLLVALLALSLQACAISDMPDRQSHVSRMPDGLRVFSSPSALGAPPVACPAFGLADPVHGTLRGNPNDDERIWLESADLRRLSVVWPAGFAVRFEPAAVLYDGADHVVASDGVEVELSQTSWSDAAGTYADPYFAQGIVFGGCYPYVK